MAIVTSTIAATKTTTADVEEDLSSAAKRFKRVAIVHYWLVTMRGGERVVEQLLNLFPDADIFTHVYDPGAVSETIRQRVVRTTFINGLPGARRHYQKYLPLMPMALEQLDLRGYDLVITSESGPAKGVIVAPDALHLCYVHSPMRYLWDHYHDYREGAGWLTRAMMPPIFHRLRIWDVASAARIDKIVANSRFVMNRIARSWGRGSVVVHPPVAIQLFGPVTDISNEYLWVGQFVRYKRPDLAVEAFNRLGLPLLMVGDGEMASDLRRAARPNIRFVDRLDLAGLRAAYARAGGLIFTAEEDFGIVPVEAMASGRPVIAFGRGGVCDSVIEDVTGQFFDEQTSESLVEAVERFERWLPSFDPSASVQQAAHFSPARFDHGILSVLSNC